jgi:hypothetical protein
VSLAVELQKIYDSEINIRIGWLWDAGIEVSLGDEFNGVLAEETVTSTADILPWLQEAIAHFYPASTYAASLSADVRQRGSKRLFQRPKTGVCVFCPHCGTPHAAPPGMDELIRFSCSHCGNTVDVKPPTVQ